MHNAITKLLSIASEPIGDAVSGADFLSRWGALGDSLAAMLGMKNGFYAYESALLVRPLHHHNSPLGLLEWNASTLWKAEYVEDLSNSLFFAEDVFGGQYCIREDKICSFDPESGLFEAISSSLDEWADSLMADYQFRTGYPLAHEWQTKNGLLSPGMRLLPKMPFVCGGKYEVENLYSHSDTKGMLYRATIANQIRDLPDGSEIVLKTESETVRDT